MRIRSNWNFTAGRSGKCYNHSGKQYHHFLKSWNMHHPLDLAILFPHTSPRQRRAYVHPKTWTQILRAVLVRAKKVDHPKVYQLDERINKLWHITHAGEYHPGIKTSRLRIHASVWINLKKLCWMKEARPEVHTAWFFKYRILENASWSAVS